MNKPANYDNTQANGSWTALPAGGYVCKIISANEEESSQGRPVLVVAFDIAEGTEAGRFQREFNADTRENKKWPNSGVYRQPTEKADGTCNPFFKGLMTSIEESNSGWKPVWGENFCGALQNKMVGMVFGREQYRKQNGELAWSTKARFVRSVDIIRAGVEPPEDKYIDATAYGFTEPASSGFNGRLPF